MHAPRVIAVAAEKTAQHIKKFPDDIQAVGLAHYSHSSSIRSGIDIHLAELGLSPALWVESDDVNVQIEAVKEGFGVAFIPENLLELAQQKGLVRLPYLGQVRITVHGLFLERTAAEHVKAAILSLIQPSMSER